MRPLVVTSINPRGRFEHQKTCFDAWRERGYDVLSYNPDHEADELIGRGVDPSAIVRLELHNTGHGIHRITSPKIVAVLDKARSRDAEAVLLINSDIYPALRRAASPFSAIGACAAMTRNEVPSLATSSGDANYPYRGGLDAFFFTAASLDKLLSQLLQDPASDRMAFGIPGWDFYLAGHVLSSRLSGRILDAAFLLHVSHPTTYGNIAEFEHYVKPLCDMGHVSAADSTSAAREFLALIHRHCENNRELSRNVALAAFDYRMQPSFAFGVDPSFDAEVAMMQAMNDGLPPSLRFDPIALVAAARAEAHSFHVVRAATRQACTPATRFFADLRALHAMLSLPTLRGQLREFTGKYPKSNLHGKALAEIMAIKDPEAFRISLLELFSNELILHGIFNPMVLKSIALSCMNREERSLVSKICRLLRERIDEKTN